MEEVVEEEQLQDPEIHASDEQHSLHSLSQQEQPSSAGTHTPASPPQNEDSAPQMPPDQLEEEELRQEPASFENIS